MEPEVERPVSPHVIVAGIPGSGSTYVWQVMNTLLGATKTHDYIPVEDDVPVLVTFRDPAASIVSACRRHFHYSRGPTLEEVREILPLFIRWKTVALRYAPRRNTTFLEYEQFWNNPHLIIERLCSLPVMRGITFNDDQVSESLALHDLDANKAISNRVHEFDSVSLIHPDHIHDATPDGWRHVVTPNVLEFLEGLRA